MEKCILCGFSRYISVDKNLLPLGEKKPVLPELKFCKVGSRGRGRISNDMIPVSDIEDSDTIEIIFYNDLYTRLKRAEKLVNEKLVELEKRRYIDVEKKA